ncbi:hypothetical protein V8G54_011838 [Vigna mungo]|uniref:DUF8041 domain-containing protein n=1 Tax=Vigna mungo TaxID=3915 RepID=A0AAQ3NT30_VIGMU
MQRKHYRGLSNPLCVHNIEVVSAPFIKRHDMTFIEIFVPKHGVGSGREHLLNRDLHHQSRETMVASTSIRNLHTDSKPQNRTVPIWENQILTRKFFTSSSH